MPRYIQPVVVGKDSYYTVFSTVTMSFLTPLSPSVKALKKSHSEYRMLKVVRTPLRGRMNEDGSLEVGMMAYVLDLEDIKRNLRSKHKSRKKHSGLDRYII